MPNYCNEHPDCWTLNVGVCHKSEILTEVRTIHIEAGNPEQCYLSITHNDEILIFPDGSIGLKRRDNKILKVGDAPFHPSSPSVSLVEKSQS